MNDAEIKRLACALSDIRPDWPISSLTTFISKTPALARRPYRDVAVALMWVATDTKPDGTPASDTPKRVLEAGPWWTAAAGTGSSESTVAPKLHDACPRHTSYLASNCGGCRSERKWHPDDPEPGVPDEFAGMTPVEAAFAAAGIKRKRPEEES